MAKAQRRTEGDHAPAEDLGSKAYERALRPLHEQLVHMQRWVQATGAKICIVFEGRDGAGKGGAIKALTERVSPRVFRVVALPAPTDREKSQMYLQRYFPHLPAAGEVVIFDRSWYNRAGVERVMKFCDQAQVEAFLLAVPLVERAIVGSNIVLIKYWLEVSEAEQTRRLEARIHDERKTWKLTDMDLKSYSRWYDYSRARDAMLAASDTDFAPWHIVRSDHKRRARLNILRHLLDTVGYERIPHKKVTLPERQKPGGYREPDYPYRYIPERY
ncbi:MULTISPECIES: polyphosphate kinase 2 [unclassified Cupriavidus]|uniref:polyphosphate kinase 2 n=1 Tax=Cupriavidus sp. H19C3 TaxID=3241603 RepID=UPI0011D34709|nr:MAG: polyphosphate kinase 2 [Cupriavidus sp.]